MISEVDTRNRLLVELRSCVKVVEVAVLGSMSLLSLTVSIDIKHHGRRRRRRRRRRKRRRRKRRRRIGCFLPHAVRNAG